MLYSVIYSWKHSPGSGTLWSLMHSYFIFLIQRQRLMWKMSMGKYFIITVNVACILLNCSLTATNGYCLFKYRHPCSRTYNVNFQLCSCSLVTVGWIHEHGDWGTAKLWIEATCVMQNPANKSMFVTQRYFVKRNFTLSLLGKKEQGLSNIKRDLSSIWRNNV